MGSFRVLVERQLADPIAAEFLSVASSEPFGRERSVSAHYDGLRLLNSLVRAASKVSVNAVRSLRISCVVLAMDERLPVYPDHRTFSLLAVILQKGQSTKS